jgi:hypothetical protein
MGKPEEAPHAYRPEMERGTMAKQEWVLGQHTATGGVICIRPDGTATDKVGEARRYESRAEAMKDAKAAKKKVGGEWQAFPFPPE